MRDVVIRIDYRLIRSAGRWGLAAALCLACARGTASESVTLSTYYPAPSGVYAQLITTGKTFLARDAAATGGTVIVGSLSSNSTALLEIHGSVSIQDGHAKKNYVLTSDDVGNASWQPPGATNVALCVNNSMACASTAGASRELMASSPGTAAANATAACQIMGFQYVGYLTKSYQTSCGGTWNGATWNGSGWPWITAGCGSVQTVISSIYCMNSGITLPPNLSH